MNRGYARIIRLLVALIFLPWWAAACTCVPQAAKPVDPHWDKEACALCRMAVSEPRFAAQIVGPGTRVRYYDDLGCALKHRHDEAELKSGRLYVRPDPGAVWVEAAAASFAEGLRTPMNYGFGAVSAGGTLDLAAVEARILAATAAMRDGPAAAGGAAP